MDELIPWHLTTSTARDRRIPKSFSEAERQLLPVLLEQKCSPDQVQLSITDFSVIAPHDAQGNPRTPVSCQSHLCNTAADVDDVFKLTTPRPRTRVISIFSGTSFGRLHVTPNVLQKIFESYKVSLDVYLMLMSLGAAPEAIEGVSSCIDFQDDSDQESSTIFQIRYPELNRRDGVVDPWSFRQTGVYHHRQTSNFDIFILFQPISRQRSEIESRLQSYAALTRSSTAESELARIGKDPSTLFPVLFSIYFSKWRWYLRSLAEECEVPCETTLSLTLQPSSQESDGFINTRFARLKILGDVMDRLVRAHVYCEGNLNVIRQIQALDPLSARTTHQLSVQRMKLHGLTEGCVAIKAQVKNVQDLLGNAIMLQTQRDATEIHKHVSEVTKEMHGLSREATNVQQSTQTVTEEMRDLGKRAAKDSAFISVISVLTALYVPGSFVGTLFGMNFFKFSDTGSRIQIAQDFWIFIVIWVPLTILNGSVFYLVFRHDVGKHGSSAKSPRASMILDRITAMIPGR